MDCIITSEVIRKYNLVLGKFLADIHDPQSISQIF
jgi:hypothetical protein